MPTAPPVSPATADAFVHQEDRKLVAASSQASTSARSGLLFALGAYLAWGFIPAYFKLLVHVPPLVVLCHRVIWSVVFLSLLLAFQRRVREVWASVRNRAALLTLAGSTVLIATNWYVFIWAVGKG